MQNETRDRLIDLVKTSPYGITSSIGETFYHSFCEKVADHLLANGVTIQNQGKWVPCKQNSGYKCSVCGSRIRNLEKHNGNHIYCHKCGAIMIKGETK